MKNWIDLLFKNENIKAIYKEFTPSLQGVVLNEITINHDGPQAFLRFDLRDYPENPPEKWRKAKYNTVQITLNLFDLKKITLNGFDKGCILDTSMKKKDGIISTVAKNENVYIEIESTFAFVSRVSAFKNASDVEQDKV